MRWKYNRYMHDYLGCIKAVDESVGRVLDYLDEEGLADNTIVVYSSDQGFYLGEHGWFDKRWIFEESLRTPLLVRWPGVDQAGQRQRRTSSPTSTSPRPSSTPPACRSPTEMQGRSLVPLLKGQTPGRLAQELLLPLLRIPRPAPRAAALRRGHRPLQAGPLLRARRRLLGTLRPPDDPHELRSVYDDPANADVVEDLKADLKRLRTELKVPDEPPKEAYGRLFAPPRQPARKGAAKKKSD